MYRLDNRFAGRHFTVTVVGCGGTGGFVAESLGRLLPPRARLALVDHDRVEEANLGRQNFTWEDLGQFKSEALANRISKAHTLPVAYSTLQVGMTQLHYPGIVVGCVDNGLARSEIAKRVGLRSSLTFVGGYSRQVPMELQAGPRVEAQLWWVDAGNGENYGQVLVGNVPNGDLCDSFTDISSTRGRCIALPLPTVQIPDLLAQRPPQPACAEAQASGDQGPVVNQAMAALVVEVVRRLIEGTCSWMQLYLDLEAGTLTPVLATPEAVARVTGISKRKLIVNYK